MVNNGVQVIDYQLVTGTIHATFCISELAIQDVSVKQQLRVNSSRGGSSIAETDLNIHKDNKSN